MSGFSSYEAARILMLSEVSALYEEPRKEQHKKASKSSEVTFHLNQWVEHVSAGVGKIIRIDEEFVTIRFDGGKEKTYSLESCKQNSFLRTFTKS